MKYLMIIALLLAPLSSFGAKAQCPRYSVTMTGTAAHMGVSYTERVEAYKVGGGAGYNGRWKVELFEQIITYPWQLGMAMTTNDVHDLGNGIRMQSTCTVGGNVVHCRSVSDTMFLEVINNRVRMERTVPWHGQVTGSTMTWKFHLESPTEPVLSGVIAEGPKEPIELTIVFPADRTRVVYSSQQPPTLELKLRAKTKPEQYAESIEWTLPEMEGVTRRVIQGAPRGSVLDVIYEKMPEDNNQFGKKKVTATLKVGICTATESREVQFFYPRDLKNNPGGQYPNWFYYWKQTPAAKPRGQLVNIEYGGSIYGECIHPSVPAQYTPGAGHATIHVCNLAKLGSQFQNRFPVLSLQPPYHLGWETSRNIDTFAKAVIHEFVHWQCYHNFRYGKSLPAIQAADTDADGLPDTVEPQYGFDPSMRQTHMSTHPELKKIKYDEEWLAYMSMSEIPMGKYNEHDWARPGNQWP
ncbi:MAG TPA: hypothetical protein PKN85_01560 [Syntrophorhabdaceae bacterium]|nr:hypothetical protein [Syntrophorhabdaceae bacterium]